MIAQAVARRAGRDPGDFAVRNLAGAVVGVVMSATLPVGREAHDSAEMFERIDAALAHLEAGLPIYAASARPAQAGRARQAQREGKADIDPAHRRR